MDKSVSNIKALQQKKFLPFAWKNTIYKNNRPYKKDAQKITCESVRKYISMAVTKLHKGRNSLREENNGKTQFYVAWMKNSTLSHS